jgi:hypothetical protein
VAIIPSAEHFLNPENPSLKYLAFLIPILEPSLGQIRLWVSHLLFQQHSPTLHRPISEPLYLMGRKDVDDDILGTTYPVTWKTEITGADEPRLRRAYSIPDSVKLRFDTRDSGAVVSTEDNEVCVYEDMFEAGFRFPFPRIVRELLQYLRIAPHQLTPNAWKTFFACIILWPKVLGEGNSLTVREFLKVYKVARKPDDEYTCNFQVRKKAKFVSLTDYSNRKWRSKFFFAQGDWEFSPSEIINDLSIPREMTLPSVVGLQEPVLDNLEQSRVDHLWEYALDHPSEMKFNAIFSQASLATCLRLPPAEESKLVAPPQTSGSPQTVLTKQTASAPLMMKPAVEPEKFKDCLVTNENMERDPSAVWVPVREDTPAKLSLQAEKREARDKGESS